MNYRKRERERERERIIYSKCVFNSSPVVMAYTFYNVLCITIIILQTDGFLVKNTFLSEHRHQCSVSLRLGVELKNGSIKKSNQKKCKPEASTLYDYFGASQNDTQEQLKIRYTELAKMLHPDSNRNNVDLGDYYDLSEINAAWEVLKDPKERKRYDRSLRAKELSEGIEGLVSLGIKTAISLGIKTADTTAAAVDISSKAAQASAEQARTAYGAFEIKQEMKAYQQKAKAEDSRASLIRKEVKSVSTKKIASLEKQQREKLSSTEARSILKKFQLVVDPSTILASLSNEIDVLDDTESQFKDASKTQQLLEQATKITARKVEQALQTEEMAKKRLEEAQRSAKDAKTNYVTAQNEEKLARSEERSSRQSISKLEINLQKAREKVRVGMLQQQDNYMSKKAKELKLEIAECERTSKKLKLEAEQMRIRLKALEKEQQ